MESHQALKNDLIDWIRKLQDQGILESLMLMKKGSGSGDWANELSPEARASIERGLEDARNGRVISSEEFWAKLGRRIEG